MVLNDLVDSFCYSQKNAGTERVKNSSHRNAVRSYNLLHGSQVKIDRRPNSIIKELELEYKIAYSLG